MKRDRHITKLVMILVSLTLCHSEAAAQCQRDDSKAVHRNALKALAIILPRDHVAHHPLDDKIAHRWFDLFVSEIDPRRVYFTADEILRFAKHRPDLDDHARRGDVSFADLVRDTYATRLQDATSHSIRLLGERHDFTTDETFELRPDGFSENQDALRDRWRKVVKYEILVERSSGLTHNDAVTKLRTRYRRMARENRFDDDDKFYELFLDTFARSFGPYNRYLGEWTLVNFRS